jgi:outer membrane protein TolC
MTTCRGRFTLLLLALVIPAPPAAAEGVTSGRVKGDSTSIRRLPSIGFRPTASPGSRPSRRAENLEQAWAAALAADQQLRAIRYSVSAAASQWQAAQAERWPSASLETSYRIRDKQPATRVVGPGFFFTSPVAQAESLSFGGRVAWPLYTGRRISHAIDAAAANISVHQRDEQAYLLDLKMRVAEEYVAVLQARDELTVARSHVQSLESHAHDIESRCHQNQARQSDLLEARAAVANGRYELSTATEQRELSQATFNRSLGRPLDDAVTIVPFELPSVEHDLDTLTRMALDFRPEIARLNAQVDALESEAASVLGEKHPQIFLLGDYQFEENRFRSPEGITSGGVGVTWNAFDAGKTRHRADSIFARAESLARSRADLQSHIRLEVRQAWLRVKESRNRLTATQASIEQAEENLEVTRELYNSGLETHTSVLNAEYLRVQSMRNHNRAVHDAVLAVLYLQRATGQI